MKISETIKEKIKSEFNEWSDKMYGGLDKKERQKLGAFFTPPELSIKMIEKFSDLKGKILDPTVGAGGLLAAVIIAGADPKLCYGIEIDPKILSVAKQRLIPMGVPEGNLIQGDATNPETYKAWDKKINNRIKFGM